MNKGKLSDIVLTLAAAACVFFGGYFGSTAATTGAALRINIIAGTITFIIGIAIGAKDLIVDDIAKKEATDDRTDNRADDDSE